MDALLGRNSKTHKLKTLAKLAIARINILKTQRHVRCSNARSDVVQLLNLGHQDRALLRVEHVIEEQNMLDAFGMIENYCRLLIERVVHVQNSRECPDELNEAISSLIFAASRCGESPELQEIRGIFISKYGKEFAACAVELRNNCRVNPKMIQKLSTIQASLESRQQLLKQIASDNGISLHLEDDVYATAGEKQDINQKEKQLQPNEVSNFNDPEFGVDAHDFPEEMTQDEKFSESMTDRNRYRDVAAAAREAFESATYAAAAARAAVELSRSESRDEDPDDHNGSNHKQEFAFISGRPSKSEPEIDGVAASEDVKLPEKGLDFDKIHPIDSFCSESVGEEDMAQNSKINHFKELERSNKKSGLARTLSSSSSDTDTDNQYDWKTTSNLDQTAPPGEEICFDESDDETGKNQDSIPWLKHHQLGSDKKSNLPTNKFQKATNYNAVADESLSAKGYKLHCQSPEWKPLNHQVELTYSAEGRSRLGNTHYLNAEKHLYSQNSHTDRKRMPMTGRQVHRD